MSRVYDVAWVLWIGWFVAFEGAALASRRPGATLSEHVWDVLRVRDRRSTPITIAARVLTAVGCLWLAGHFAMGWWTTGG